MRQRSAMQVQAIAIQPTSRAGKRFFATTATKNSHTHTHTHTHTHPLFLSVHFIEHKQKVTATRVGDKGRTSRSSSGSSTHRSSSRLLKEKGVDSKRGGESGKTDRLNQRPRYPLQ